MGVNESLGQWSDLFMVLAAMTYLVSFVAFAWDMASSSMVLRRAEERAQLTRQRQLVHHGGPVTAAASAGDAQSVDTDPPAGRAWQDPDRDTPGRISGANPQDPVSRHVARAGLSYTGQGSRPAARVAVAVMALGALVHAAAVISRGMAASRVPWGNLYEFFTTGALMVTAIFLILLIVKDLRFIGTLISGLVLIMLCAATIGFPTPVGPIQPALQSWWLVIHVSVAVLASAIFTITFAMSVLQLIQMRREARVVTGEPAGVAFMGLVPSSQVLENFSYRLNAVGFAFWTFTLAAGAIWAEQAWGRYWGWDPKEVWTFVIWVVYAAYMHARATRGWTGTRSAWLSIAGYACIIFNQTVVNTYFQGLHSYA